MEESGPEQPVPPRIHDFLMSDWCIVVRNVPPWKSWTSIRSRPIPRSKKYRTGSRKPDPGPDQGDPVPRRAEKVPVKADRVLSFATRGGSAECPTHAGRLGSSSLTGKPEPICCWFVPTLCHRVFFLEDLPLLWLLVLCHHSRVASPQRPLHSLPPPMAIINNYEY